MLAARKELVLCCPAVRVVDDDPSPGPTARFPAAWQPQPPPLLWFCPGVGLRCLLRNCYASVCASARVCVSVRPSVRRVQASRDLQRAYLCDGCCSQSCCSPLTSAADHGECGRLRVQRQGLDRSWRLRRRLQGQAEKSNRLTAMFSPPTTCRSIMADPT